MMKVNPAPFHLAQAIITGLVVALSIAILGTSAHTLDVYNKQQTSNPWWMPLWPQHYDTHGTKALIASSVVTLVLCGAFLIASFIPQLSLPQKPTLRALLSLATLLPSTLLTLTTTIYAHILNNNTPELDTIQTWTCKYSVSSPLPQDRAMPAGFGNGNFGSLCRESRFALWGTLTVFLLLCGGLAVTIVAWLADKVAARQRRKEGVEMGDVSQ
ncbi:hypothetical protein IAQ61_005053 [Plenodomus lingam]|uniref:MARVEL domain-containing protein n=1 Tax=Leptosphaeria maculans (strain JN3 / isolate v23.1.3 / race Av1-4-5-6-7-8) TaxID=985895 RepID=E5A7V0_LEPMJ|nr:hypothetical protein LEMA_P089340.1 [Plenodomus lingam JN3]KAH9872218.1 hypothetical protein IAQ61_005053 [Plenodomus lingam]CBX99695.1 hypothetical protein LEMA_P089340.1 [Plenodomus lingam JN3]